MEEPIRKEDIIDVDGTIVSLNDLIKKIQELSSAISQMKAESKKEAFSLFNSVQGINPASPEGQAAMKNFMASAEQLQAKTKEETRLKKELLKVETQLNSLSSDEAAQIAKVKVAIESKNKALKDNEKYAKAEVGSINDLKRKLKELKTAYEDLGGPTKKQTAEVNKLTEQLKKAEGAIGNNTRSVGSYKTAIIGAAKQMLGFVSPIALVAAGLNKLKTAFFETESGTKFLSKWQQGWKTFWQNIQTNMSMEDFAKSIGKARDVAEELDKIRKGDREDLVVTSRLETDIEILRYKAANAGLKEVEVKKLLIQAQEKEDELMAYNIADKKEELGAINKLLEARKEDATLLDERARLIAEIIRLEGSRNLRIQSRLTGLEAKDVNEDKKLRDKLTEQQKKQLDESLQIEKDVSDYITELHDDYYERTQDQREKDWENSMKYAELEMEQQRKVAKAEWDLIQETAQKRADAEEEGDENRRKALDEAFAVISNSVSQLGDLYQAQKENELSAAGDSATKREEIERKYAKKQQTLAIGQALIDGAATVVGIWRKWAPINLALAQIFSAISVASTLAQVAIIKSQKFAHGGAGVLEGPSHQRGGINVGIGEAEGGEHIAITSRRMTARYGPKMLNAVADSINQGKFFEVWANVNKEMTSDPYTKKMYDLMLNTPTIYQDSYGSTVKEYPDGRKYVIKRFYKN